MIDTITLWSCPRHEVQANIQGAIECLSNQYTILVQNYVALNDLVSVLA
jgi:hypothetical protein